MGLSVLRAASYAALALLDIGMARAQIITSQYDNQRTGATLGEKTLTPQNVNVQQFGKLGTFKVDGAVYAQPLFLPAVDVPGKGKHNVLFVATEHDSVYAFDADRPGDPPLWRVSLLDKAKDESSVPARSVQCPFIRPEIGITPTPVIDLKTGTLYVLARSMTGHVFAGSQYFQHLHALAITTGAEKFGGPKLITASVAGRGDGAANGQVGFDPLRENPRAALLLVSGTLYLSWASSCDVGPYHGWLMAYSTETLEQKGVLNITPDGSEGGIWESDTGPAADASGNIYVPTANGTFSAASGGRDYGDSVLKLGLAGSSIEIRDYFTPYNQAQLSEAHRIGVRLNHGLTVDLLAFADRLDQNQKIAKAYKPPYLGIAAHDHADLSVAAWASLARCAYPRSSTAANGPREVAAHRQTLPRRDHE